jgi:hypothetical protein
MPKTPQSWVQSQHPPTQWNMTGGDKVVLNKVPGFEKKEKILNGANSLGFLHLSVDI